MFRECVIIITNGCILPFISKPKLARVPLIRSCYKALEKRTSSDFLYPVSTAKNTTEKVENVKSLGILQSPVSCTKASPKGRKVQDRNSSVNQGLPDSRGMGIIDRSIRHLPPYPQPSKLKEIPKVLPQVFQFTFLLFGLATAPEVFTMIVKEMKLMALARGLRLHQYLDNWLIRSLSQKEAQVNTQAIVDLTQSLGWIINQEKSELKPIQVFLFVGYKYHLDSALVKPH